MQIFGLRRVEQVFVGWRGAGHAELFTSPCAQIMIFTAFTAKRAVCVAGSIDTFAAATGAFDDGGASFNFVNRCHSCQPEYILEVAGDGACYWGVY
jgi:hypothetical protein